MKPSQILCRRVRYFKLTTKQASHDYYKGNRTGSMGTHTKHGGYIIDYKKVRSYVCPDLKGFDVCNQLPMMEGWLATDKGSSSRHSSPSALILTQTEPS